MRPAPIRTATATAVIAALTLAGFATTPAQATPASTLFLTISGAENTWIRGVQLDCHPTSTGHPKADEACAALDTAGGRLDAIRNDPHICTMEYNPVTATANGTWRGLPISWQKTYSNACALHSETGPIFRF